MPVKNKSHLKLYGYSETASNVITHYRSKIWGWYNFWKVLLCSPSLHSFEYHMIRCDGLLTCLQSPHLLFWLGFIDDWRLRWIGLNVTQWLRRRVVIVSCLLCVFPLLYPVWFVITFPIITLFLLLWAHPLQLRVMKGCGEVGRGGCGWMGGV